MAGLTAAIPGIMWLSAHKDALFALSGLLMIISSSLWWQQRHAPCPIDPVKAAACMRLRRLNKWLLGVAWAAYACGIFLRLPLDRFVLLGPRRPASLKEQPQTQYSGG